VIIKKLWAYLYGYLTIVVKGVHPERFINMAIARGIQLWDLSWDSTDTLTVKIYAQSFRTLRHVARQSRCRVRICRKSGFPFLIKRFRRRRMLLIGAIVFVLALYFLSSLIWTVDVSGTRKLSSAQVKELVAAEGLKPGNFCFQLDRDQIENQLLRQLPEVSFVEVNIQPRAKVKVVEKKTPAPSQGPCHIVAKKEGVIDSILVLEGQGMVKEGDLVKKGQVLISGAIYPPLPEPDPAKPEPQLSDQKPVSFVNAQGVVYGKYWYRFYGEALLDEVVKEKTGRQVRRYSIIMGGKELIIKGPEEIPYKYYESQTKSKILRWRNQTLPGAEDAIYQLISDITISMESVDFLKMPECMINEVPVYLNDKEQSVYDRFREEMVLEFADEEIDAMNAAVLSGKLLQMANGAIYDDDKNTHIIHDRKLDALEDLIEGANGKPVLIAYWYNHDLERIKAKFNVREIKTSKDIKDWNNGDISVAVIHPASAGHGLNLQSGGSTLIWFGLTWSLELYQQTNARLWRQGQNETVVIHHIITKGTIDEDVMNALKRKEKTQSDLINAVKANLGKARDAV
jgi:sporulation protein YqfD